MKAKIINLLSQPSTWRGLIMMLGGMSALGVHFINERIQGICVIVAMFLSGLIATLTDDAKQTKTQVDDILNAVAKGVRGDTNTNGANEE